MRAGAETKGRVAIALAIGFCVAAGYAEQVQQSRPSSGSREVTVSVILSIEDDLFRVTHSRPFLVSPDRVKGTDTDEATRRFGAVGGDFRSLRKGRRNLRGPDPR